MRRTVAAILSPRAAWLAVVLILLAGAAGLWGQRAAIKEYFGTAYRVTPHILVISSDDWGGYDPPETLQDVQNLTDTLGRFKDSYGRPPVLTANIVAARPDLEAIRASGWSSYSCRFAYDGQPAIVELWRSLIANDRVEIGFHGREHWNVPLYMSLVSQDGPYRQAGEHGQIPYRDEAYNRLGLSDHRLQYLQRSFIDASCDPPIALEPQMQQQIIREGLEMIRQHFGVEPRIAVAPGHVYDLSTCRALAASGVPFLETTPAPVLDVAADGSLKPTGFCAGPQADLAGVLPVLRTEGYEPTWNSVFGSGGQFWPIRTSLVRDQPLVLSTHKAGYTGLADPVKARHREELARLLANIQREFPDVVFLSSADLACYLHGRPEQAHRRIDFSMRPLSTAGKLQITAKTLMLCHFKFRLWVYILSAALAWATLRTAVAWLQRRRQPALAAGPVR